MENTAADPTRYVRVLLESMIPDETQLSYQWAGEKQGRNLID